VVRPVPSGLGDKTGHRDDVSASFTAPTSCPCRGFNRQDRQQRDPVSGDDRAYLTDEAMVIDAVSSFMVLHLTDLQHVLCVSRHWRERRHGPMNDVAKGGRPVSQAVVS